MANIYRFSDGVVDFGERLADVADAVQGKGNRKGGARWLILPAAGAGLYALAANRTFARQAKRVMNEAKERASDLPEDLVGRVQQVTGTASRRKPTATSGTGSQRRRKTGSQRRGTTGSQRRRKTGSTAR